MYSLILAIVLIALTIFVRRRNAIKDPPGPFCLPIIGSPCTFGKERLHLHYTLTQLAKKYGPIYKIGLGAFPMVIITDPDMIREAFAGSNPPVLLRLVSKTIWLSYRGESLFMAQTREYWALMRKICSPMTRTLGGIPLHQLIVEEKTKLFAEIDKHIGREVHLNPLFMFFTRNVFLRIMQGKSWSFENITPEMEKFTESTFSTLAQRKVLVDFLPLPEFYQNYSRKAILKSASYMHEYIRKMLEDKRKTLASSLESAKDLLDIMLLESKETPEITDDAIIATLRSLFIAGTATSADTLDWMLLYLCVNPEIQEKCYEEIKEQLKGRPPTLEDQTDLPYLDRVIKETFRLRPPAPLALPRIAERDFTLGGYHIKKGTFIMKNLYGIGNLENFYENHAKFDPDRWLRKPDASNLLQFGVGPTTCLGMPIAKQEVFLTAASLVQRYRFAIGPTSPAPDFVGEFNIVFNPSFWKTSIYLR